MLRAMDLVTHVRVSAVLGSTEDAAGTRRTSSKVRASRISMGAAPWEGIGWHVPIAWMTDGGKPPDAEACTTLAARARPVPSSCPVNSRRRRPDAAVPRPLPAGRAKSLDFPPLKPPATCLYSKRSLGNYGHKRACNKRIGPGGGTRRLHQITLRWGDP